MRTSILTERFVSGAEKHYKCVVRCCRMKPRLPIQLSLKAEQELDDRYRRTGYVIFGSLVNVYVLKFTNYKDAALDQTAVIVIVYLLLNS